MWHQDALRGIERGRFDSDCKFAERVTIYVSNRVKSIRSKGISKRDCLPSISLHYLYWQFHIIIQSFPETSTVGGEIIVSRWIFQFFNFWRICNERDRSEQNPINHAKQSTLVSAWLIENWQSVAFSGRSTRTREMKLKNFKFGFDSKCPVQRERESPT